MEIGKRGIHPDTVILFVLLMRSLYEIFSTVKLKLMLEKLLKLRAVGMLKIVHTKKFKADIYFHDWY